MLSDHHVEMLWRKLFRGQEITTETFTQAENLLDELGQTSPLRIRLAQELSEIQAISAKKLKGE